MSFLRHFAVALSYAAAAIAVALTLPIVVADLGRWTAVALGALIFLFGAFLHESYARSRRNQALRRDLAESREARVRLETELAEARADLRTIRRELTVPTPGPDAAGPSPAAAAGWAAAGAVPLDLTAMMREPEDLSGGEVTVAVRKAVSEDRVEVVSWPIMLLPQRTPTHLECFPRVPVRDGEYLHPHRHAERVRDTGHSAAIDRQVLLRAVNLARAPGRDWRSPACFVALSPFTLRDSNFLEEVATFLDDNREPAKRLVIEVDLDDLPMIAGPRHRYVDQLVNNGVRFALVGVGKVTNVDPDLLLRSGIRFVKVAAQSLLAQARDPVSGFDMTEIKRKLDRAAADLVVTGVDDQSCVLDVLDAGVDFASGAAFGPPTPT